MSFFDEILYNKPLWVAILSWAIAQLAKVILDYYKNKNFDLARFIGSGGMPSSHSSFVCAMTISLGKLEGFNSSLFALAAAFSLIVMVDAAGVRRAAGEQAAVINIIVEKLEKSGIVLDERLKELLGHRPIEVFVGAVLGITLGICI